MLIFYSGLWPARRRIAALLTLLATAPGAAAAATWQVPGALPTIGSALAVAVSGDTVMVAGRRYQEHGLVLPAGVVLRGPNDNPATVVIDGLGQGRILDVAPGEGPAVVIGVTFVGGSAPPGFLEGLGGGIRCRGAALRLEHCRFRGNRARLGAGLGVEASTVTVRDCTFTANLATDSTWAAGGGAWCRATSGSFHRVEFLDNTAFSVAPDNPGDAGGLYLSGCAIDLADATFSGNTAGAGAGGLYSVNGDSSTIRRCTFTAGRASWGGALYLEASRARLDSCAFAANSARSGGAVYLDRQSATVLTSCRFIGNRADLAGGAVADWNSGPTFIRCRFEANEAGTNGGALHGGGDYARLEDCVLYANTAQARGGGIYGFRTSLQMAGCSVVANAAPDGGGLACDESFPVLQNTVIAFATLGAAVTGTYAEFMVLECCDIYGNEGGDWTGPVAGRDGVDGNLAVDPSFCALASGGLDLAPGSPLLAAGACGPIGAGGAGCGAAPVPETPPAPAVSLGPAYPNPFNPRVTLPFALGEDGPVEVAVFDLAGRRVRVLRSGWAAAGDHAAVWDGRDAAGRAAAAGVYLVRVRGGGQSAGERVMLVK